MKKILNLSLLMLLLAISCKKKDSTSCSFNLCGNFEDATCFDDNWVVSPGIGSGVVRDNSTSYNSSTSLHFTNAYTPGAINLPESEISRYVECIQTNAVYKVTWMAKYKGYMANDNGPVMYMAAEDETAGTWLDYNEVGVSNGSYVDVDWQMFSFQFTAASATPIKLIFGTNIQDCWIDDIKVTKL